MQTTNDSPEPESIRRCREDDFEAILSIINTAAEAYRGVIPADCWHEPYMSAADLRAELVARIEFFGFVDAGTLVGVMGIQSVRDVDLIRHAYVLPSHQGRGIGSALLESLCSRTVRPILIGTWAAASWAIRFYERHGFDLVPEQGKTSLLKKYWTVSERQIECSVVLSKPGRETRDASR